VHRSSAVQLPAHANAYAERFVWSIKEECLDRMIPLGERHLRRTIAEFVAHYHGERNHQGIGNELRGPARLAGVVWDRTRGHTRAAGADRSDIYRFER